MKKSITTATLIALASTSFLVTPKPTIAQQAEICHVANAGFFITDGKGNSLLLDAVMGTGLKGYEAPTAETNLQIEEGTDRFESVDLVLATHFHDDHYMGNAVSNHMAHNPETKYLIPVQAQEELSDGADKSRILNEEITQSSKHSFTVGGITVDAYGIDHGASYPIENVGYHITIGGKTFFHPGDMSTTREQLTEAGLNKLPVDYLLLPFWHMLDPTGMPLITESFDYKNIIPMHLPTEDKPWMAQMGGLEAMIDIVFQDKFAAPLHRLTGQMDCIAY